MFGLLVLSLSDLQSSIGFEIGMTESQYFQGVQHCFVSSTEAVMKCNIES